MEKKELIATIQEKMDETTSNEVFEFLYLWKRNLEDKETWKPGRLAKHHTL